MPYNSGEKLKFAAHSLLYYIIILKYNLIYLSDEQANKNKARV